jgi:hypothetical protein
MSLFKVFWGAVWNWSSSNPISYYITNDLVKRVLLKTIYYNAKAQTVFIPEIPADWSSLYKFQRRRPIIAIILARWYASPYSLFEL